MLRRKRIIKIDVFCHVVNGANRLALAVCFYLLFAVPALCQVRLPRLISDGMVLQRDTEVKIWGWAEAAEKVVINFNGNVYHTITNPNGTWVILLPTLEAGGPYNMEIDGSNHITIKNILIGDVWVCSGQSNMELPMQRVRDKYPSIIATGNNSNIRQFLVPDTYNFQTPQDDLEAGSWESANPENVLQFTAVGYFFAKSLYEKYHVPIGLVNASLGGSPMQAWMSEDALKEFPIYQETANKYKDPAYINQVKEKDKTASDAWYGRLGQLDKGLAKGQRPWFDPSCDTSDWASMTVPAFWADEALGPVNGVVWFRKEIEVPATMVGKPARLLLGCIVDSDTVYVNGVVAGATGYQYPPRKYDLPATMLKEGKNVIVIRVVNTIGRGGFVKDKPYELVVRDQMIDLKGPWRYKLGAVMEPLPGPTFIQWQPVGLYNAMIAPLLNYSIKGAIWYQGESNTADPQDYQRLFGAMIADWRRHWRQGDFPFLYVQLANFMQARSEPSESNWAQLRQAQLETLAVSNTAMAVTIDIGEWNDIHPLNKEDVGKRLTLGAEKIAYGDRGIVHSGPVYHAMRVDGNKIVLTFKYTGSGLVAKDGELKQFAIAGADGKFVWAKARIENDQVVVWNDAVINPVAVRYAWADNPEGANLYNQEGLPASPFETKQ